MNERFLFRGKRKDNGKWVYGWLRSLHSYDPQTKQISGIYFTEISDDLRSRADIIVDYKTVGQCTGLEDKNGKLIFEGDVLKGFTYPFLSDGEYDYYALVVWSKDYCAFRLRTIKAPQSKVRGILDGNTEFINNWNSDDWEVIGNDYDNPELLEV